MGVLVTCRIADALGTHLIEVGNYLDLDYVLNCSPGAIGTLELTLPASFNTDYLKRDGRIGVWRSINGRPPYMDGNAIYLIETFIYRTSYTKVTAYHATTLMDRRIISYAAGSSYASKSATYADNLIKTFWAENAGASISAADRDGVETQADISAYVSTQANLSLGASVAKAAARRSLLETAKELADASATAGTYLTFEIIAPTESTLELRTYATQRGVDHRASTAQPVILSEQRGNLENAELAIDYHNEVTFAVAGGQGEQTNRLIATTMDTTRAGISPFGRIERLVDMSNISDATALQDEADAAVRNGRPVTVFTGDLIETPALTRGIHFDLGDIVTAEHPRSRQQFDVRLDVIHEHISKDGRKTEIGLRSTT